MFARGSAGNDKPEVYQLFRRFFVIACLGEICEQFNQRGLKRQEHFVKLRGFSFPGDRRQKELDRLIKTVLKF